MLDEMIVVKSAVSAFNNAALAAPAFLWTALLSLPLFAVVWMFGRDIANRIGWDTTNLLARVSVWGAGLTLGWIVLFGGNYAVLRDGVSVLPMMNAGIVFLTSLFVSSHLHKNPMLRGWKKSMLFVLLLCLVAFTDVHVWWGPLLQAGAFACGVLLGWYAHAEMRPVSGTVLIVLMVVCAMLMQPEFYRFGQLGNLTVAHLGTMLVLGVAAVACTVLINVNAMGRINNIIYFKLKWLLRVICALGAALFILTEAVPVFIGTLLAFAMMFAISVWHAKNVNLVLCDKLFALLLMLFGVVTIMPAITALGIVYWVNTPLVDFWREIRVLL